MVMKREGHFFSPSLVPQCFKRACKEREDFISEMQLQTYNIKKQKKNPRHGRDLTMKRKQHKQEAHIQTYQQPNNNHYMISLSWSYA